MHYKSNNKDKQSNRISEFYYTEILKKMFHLQTSSEKKRLIFTSFSVFHVLPIGCQFSLSLNGE